MKTPHWFAIYFMLARGAFLPSYYAISYITSVAPRTIVELLERNFVELLNIELELPWPARFDALGRLPAAAECFIQSHEICRHRRPALSKFVLRDIKRPLSVEDIEKIIESPDIKLVGHGHGPAVGSHRIGEGTIANLLIGVVHQSSFHVLKGSQDRFFVLR